MFVKGEYKTRRILMENISEKFEVISLFVVAVGALAAATSAYFSAKSSKTTLELYKKDRKEKLHDELNTILKIGIEYPYLESKDFTYKWNELKCTGNENYLRYDMYCNLIFNYIHHICEYYCYNKEEIEGFVDVKTWLRIHRQCWLNPMDENENVDGYDEKFRQFVNSYLK